MMDEADSSNKQSKAEHDSVDFKLKLFQIEKVECDRSIRYPHPRSGHRIVANDLYIYSFGGYNPDAQPDPFSADDPNWQISRSLFQELWKFCKFTRTWSLMRPNEPADPPPVELASHSAVLLDDLNKILVYGGSGATFGEQSSNKMHTVDLNTSKWTRINYNNDVEDPIPLPMYGQAVAFDCDNEKLYVVGGTTGFEYFLDVHAFDWTEKKWTRLNETLPSEIEVRYRHEIALWDNKIYVVGGGTVHRGFSLEMIPIFDLNTNTWSKKQTRPHVNSSGVSEFPPPRFSHDCAQLGSTIYVVGGIHGVTTYKDIWSLDLTTLTWTRLPCSLPTGLYFHSVAISDEGQLSVFGGVNSVHPKVRNNTYYEVWVKVPKLKTLARMAFFAKFGADKKKLKEKVGEYLQDFSASFETLQLDFLA